jgi:hypothetical protein
MDKNIQSVYVTGKGYCYKVLFNQQKILIGKEEFQFLEKKLINSKNLVENFFFEISTIINSSILQRSTKFLVYL